MKRVLLFAILLYTSNTYSQVAILNTQCLQKDCGILFSQVENKITISGLQKGSTTKLYAGNSNVQFVTNSEYIVSPINQVPDTLKLYINGKKALTQVFKMETLRDPVASVGGYHDTVLSVSKILANPYMTVIFPGSSYTAKFWVSNFKVFIKNIGGESIELIGHEPTFTPAMIDAIKSLKPGAKIYFDRIKATSPEGKSGLLPSISITIK